ncbi:hypothetical protein [Helicobacter sp. 23-1045]
MQKFIVIARRIIDLPKQSTNETYESNVNRLLLANLRLDSKK